MKRFALVVLIALAAVPLAAQSRLGLIVDLEGVHRQEIEPVIGPVRYEPSFDKGGGLGVGLNWHFSDRFSIEAKVAGLASHMHLRIDRGDHIANADLGYAQFYPVMLTAQWHPLEGKSIRPYLGIGLAHIILRNIDETNNAPPVEFDDPTGVVLNGGIRVPISSRWSFNADARYIPVESHGEVRFLGPNAARADIDVRPLVLGFGVIYHY